MIKQILDKNEKQKIARQILEALPEWFEVEEGREEYIAGCVDWIFLADFSEDAQPAYEEKNDCCTGFLCLKETGNATVEIAVMGVRKDYHRKGIGKQLVEKSKEIAREAGYSFMQVKTVQLGKYEDYDRTNHFYIACGFKEFEVFPLLWDEDNPCQIYVMSL